MSDPQLAAPGAGLPEVERLLLSAGVRLLSWKMDQAAALAQFNEEADKIRTIISGLDEKLARKQVLIPRLRGLEDSSRFWSPCMVVQHLMIVDEQILKVIAALSAGVVPPGKVSTAAVKPEQTASLEVIPAFQATVESWNASIPSLRLAPSPRYTHPWFGPMPAHRWLCLAAVHHGLHRKQLERILD